MNRIQDTALAEAAAWHAASEDDDMDWDAFTAWLDVDPRHRRAYDEIALADALVADHRARLNASVADVTLEERAPARRPALSWKRFAGVAIAASLVALLVVPTHFAASSQTYETGKLSRRVALKDGSSIVIAPHSRLTVDGNDQSRLALTGGAWFDIVHDPDRPLTIQAGETRISDIGTRFDVQSESARVRVEVADGNLEVASASLAQPIRLAAGKGLLFDADAGTAIVTAVAANDMGEWRSGRLSYNAAPLAVVAADLARYASVKVMVPATLANRRFSGTLVLGDGEAALLDLSQVMELALYRDDGGYRLAERSR